MLSWRRLARLPQWLFPRASAANRPRRRPLGFSEGGGWDVAVASNGKALLDGQFLGSGWVNLRQLDLATGAITNASGLGSVRQNTLIARGGDRSLLFLTESNISSGPLHTY